MATPRRRVPPPEVYAQVPTSPTRGDAYSTPMTADVQRNPSHSRHRREDTVQGVQTGAIGSGYGPYSYRPDNLHSNMYRESRFSTAPSEHSSYNGHDKANSATPPNSAPLAATTTLPPYLWDAQDPDLDDPLHNPDPARDRALDRKVDFFSIRGWANATMLFVLITALLVLFAGYPIIADATRSSKDAFGGFNLGGINASGQIPELTNFPLLVDPDTSDDVKTKTGSDGNQYTLVFSDEFNTDGRTFYPGDDPYWEAVDLHYWPTGDLEWYDPSAITTADGKLVITMTEVENHDLNFMSGMLQGWNKFCFTTGILEVSVSLPGDAETPGFWPAVWTMGNLGRAGYGATTDGMWPYTYAACDTGTFPNQTDKSGNPSTAAGLSFLPGQKVSACTCEGSDHPGPDVETGRGVPEIDVFEAQIDLAVLKGQMSQSYQVAPFDFDWQFENGTQVTTIYDDSQTELNSYKGSIYQEALSALTYTDSANYNDNGYATYGFEWWSDENHRDQGYIQWESGGSPAWKITAGSCSANAAMDISQRLISEEPHYIIFNFGMAPGFQGQDFKNLKFPSKMYIDWVRVYQREGSTNIGCDPASRPTENYINNHIEAYTDPNLTTWEGAGYTFPRNSLYDGC